MVTASTTRPGRLPLAQRAQLLESLDDVATAGPDLESNLRDLARLNRFPGGTSASIAGIESLLPRPRREVAVMDVGTGGADMALAFARRGWRTTAVDPHPDVLRVARAAVGSVERVRVVTADGRSLPFADGSFDVAHCSLLVHHLDPPDAVALLGEMGRVARRGVVINDLRRGVMPFVATGVMVALLGTCRATRADGLASVRRAYTLAELDGLLDQAGLRVAWQSARRMPRVVTAAVRRVR